MHRSTPLFRLAAPRRLLSERIRTALLLALGVAAALAPARAGAQEAPAEPTDREGLELLDQEPFDVITIKESAGGGQVKVAPLDFPQRRVPERPTGRLQIRLLSHPGEMFEIAWGDIERIDLWEQRLLSEAKSRIAENDFDGAFPYLSVLLRDYPETPGLDELRTQFLYRNAGTAFRNGELKKTLAILEELRRFRPDYQAQTVGRVIAQVTDRMLTELLEEERLEEAQLMLARLERDYSADEISSIPKWRRQFREMALSKRDEAIAARDAEDYRAARQLAREAAYIDPELEGTAELIREINGLYPLVKVGVLQRATRFDPTRIDNWPARRSGRLIYRSLFEMRGAGPEGGEYDFLLGDAELSADLRQLTFRVSPDALRPPLNQADGFDLVDLLLARADPEKREYDAAWAGVFGRLAIPAPADVIATFRRPHVLPQALLQVRIDAALVGGKEDDPTGLYRTQPDPEGFDRYVFSGEEGPASGQPREILEAEMPSSDAAVSALLRGEVDVVDQLFPADAARLRQGSQVRVEDYPLPTVHALIPCSSDHPYLANRTFRRALVYAINRQQILTGELLGGQSIPGCEVVSGPFPAGIGGDDPLAYAYDRSIRPRTYQPRLAKLLIEMTTNQLVEQAERREEEPPELPPLRIALPANDLARVACEAIEQQLEMVGLEIELVELPPGLSQPEEPDQCDMLYVIAAVWEPIVDARRLLGPEGLARSGDQLVGLALRQVEAARNWREVRERLLELHAIAHNELPVMPLWQLVDSFAYRPEVSGIGRRIVSLYQNVEQWRVEE